MTGAKRFSIGETVRFTYFNHKRELGERYVIVMDLMWGTTPHYSTPQWLIKCYDLDKKDYRTFALHGIRVKRSDLPKGV